MFVLPLPPDAGGEFGQAPVYTTTIQYEVAADEWRVTDDTFTTNPATTLANHDIWTSNWNDGFYHRRDIPGKCDEPIGKRVRVRTINPRQELGLAHRCSRQLATTAIVGARAIGPGEAATGGTVTGRA